MQLTIVVYERVKRKQSIENCERHKVGFLLFVSHICRHNMQYVHVHYTMCMYIQYMYACTEPQNFKLNHTSLSYRILLYHAHVHVLIHIHKNFYKLYVIV